jgi:hypothetical protein
MDEGIKKMSHMEFYSAITNENYIVCRKIDGTRDHHIK